jgi:hypothetical protein
MARKCSLSLIVLVRFRSWLLGSGLFAPGRLCLGASKLRLSSIPITASRKFVPDHGLIEFRRIILPQAA